MQITKQDFLDLGSNKLFIGDPCYVLNHEDYESGVVDVLDNSSQFEGVEGTTSKGIPVTEWCDTKYGDGDYPSSSGKFYGVDAGILGVSVITDIKKYDEETLNELGQVITVPENTDYVNINVFRDSEEDGDVNINISIYAVGEKSNKITEVIYTSEDEEDDYYEDEEDDYYEESKKVNRKSIKEASEKSEICLNAEEFKESFLNIFENYKNYFRFRGFKDFYDYPERPWTDMTQLFWTIKICLSWKRGVQNRSEIYQNLKEDILNLVKGKAAWIKIETKDIEGKVADWCGVPTKTETIYNVKYGKVERKDGIEYYSPKQAAPLLIQMVVDSYNKNADYWNGELEDSDLETVIYEIIDDLSQSGDTLPGLHGDNIGEDDFERWFNRYFTSRVINEIKKAIHTEELEESRKVNKKYLRESEENHTIELLYRPFFKLHCSDFPNEDYIESANYDFWGSVDKNCQRLVELNNDLTEFLPGDLEGKVTSVKLSLDDNQVLHASCSTTSVDDSVKAALIDWLNGQMSDGWGENFEQEELGSTEMYACYDENDTSPRPYVEFYDSEREAKEYCQEQNDYEEDEEDEDEEVPYYVYDSVEAYATCSFWKKGLEIPSKVYVDGYDEKGYDVGGYDKEGFNSRGKDKDGFDRNGLNSSGFDREGFDKDGFDKSGRDRDGFDKSGKKASGVKGVNTDRSGKAFIADPYSGLRTQEEKVAFRKGLREVRNNRK